MRFFFAIIFLIFSSHFSSQVEYFKSSSIENGVINIQTNKGNYSIRYFNEKAVETSFSLPSSSDTSSSHAILAKTQFFELNEKRGQNHSVLFSIKFKKQVNSISIAIDSVPFNITYYFGNEKLFSQVENSSESKKFKLGLAVSSEEVFYGGGARALGMNRRGNKLELYNQAHYGYETNAPLMNYCIPMVLSSNKYAIHFDSPGAGFIDLDSKNINEIQIEIEGSRKTYQIVASESWDSLMRQWTELSGRQPKLPLWTFGNFASRFGYHSQREVEDIVDRFKNDKIPLDAVIIDLYWFGKTIQGTLGNLEFDRDSFPEPEKMMRSLKSKNIQTILVTEPFVLTTSNRWNDAVKNDIIAKDTSGKILTYDFYFGNTGLIDIFEEKGRKWFWKRYDELKKMSVAGFWGDLGEPEVHPNHMMHKSFKAREVHNIYGHRWAEMLFSGLKLNYPNERPFILMRAGYSGSQRFGMIPWSGDVNRTWGGMRSQPEISIQMGMQGIPYMHSDLGGFAGANDDPELYLRWLQYGVFQPVFRPHAQEEVPAEPVFKDNETKELAKQAIELRYRLLPYNYTLMYKAAEFGQPLMRPIFFEDKRPEMLYVDSIYFWGNEFLVAPIFIKNQRIKEIHFPNSANWFDFNNLDYYKGGTSAKISLTKNHIPIFVKGGAFIPLIQNLQNTSELENDKVKIHFFFDPETLASTGFLYQDDYHKGNEIVTENIQRYTYTNSTKNFEILIESMKKKSIETNFILYSPLAKITKISVNGKKISFDTDNFTYSLSNVKIQNTKAKIKVWYEY
ncbi:MAG: glycosyl hydrolase [Bacteroidetes bacterium]|nr:glycosyl hydrolase [Bacteroidota bacterium]